MPLPSDPSLSSSRTIGLYAQRRAAVVDAPAGDAQQASTHGKGGASGPRATEAPTDPVARQEARSRLADQLGDMFAQVRANRREARAAARDEAKAARDAKVQSATALLLEERARRAK